MNRIDPARAEAIDPRDHLHVAMSGAAAVCLSLQAGVLSSPLVEAARALIAAEAEHTLAKGPDGYAPLRIGLAREQAFLTFKQLFEQEFPND